ncbi:MAG: nuclear transport factor 2 family protein [Acidobacteriota bacterium]
MKLHLVRALLVLAFAGVSLAAVEDEIKTAEQQWAAAAKSGDAAQLNRLLSNDIVYTHATGIIDNKTSYIEKVKSKRQKYDGIVPSNVHIKVFDGHTAVLTARMRMHGTNAAGPFDDQVLMTHVWVKTNGAWQLVAHQTTKVQ